jgi:(p)ppGpp synthase/HD superfamily hydrolase
VNKTNIVDVAMQIAMEYHGGDRNKHDGEIYLAHVARVWMNVRDAGGDETQQAIAWLHDTLEDTTLTTGALMTLIEFDYGFGNDVANRVLVGVYGMTKVKGETNEDYYHRCKLNEDSRFVKLRGDMVDNFRRNHNIKDPATRERMAIKYSLGMDILS